MSSGQKAAAETKGVSKGIHDIGVETRKNVSSFADGLVGVNKTSGSTGFFKDAQVLGNEITKGVQEYKGRLELFSYQEDECMA